MSAADLFLLTSQGKDGGWGTRGNREFQGQKHFLVQPNRKERLGIIINYFYYSAAVKRTIKGPCSPLCSLLHALTPSPPPFSFFFFSFNSCSLQGSKDLTLSLRLEVGEAQKQIVKALDWKKKPQPQHKPGEKSVKCTVIHRATWFGFREDKGGGSARET